MLMFKNNYYIVIIQSIYYQSLIINKKHNYKTIIKVKSEVLIKNNLY